VLEIMAGKQPSPPKDYSHNVRGNGEVIDGVEFEKLPEVDEPAAAAANAPSAVETQPETEAAPTTDDAPKDDTTPKA
jgi:hypothetical protein